MGSAASIPSAVTAKLDELQSRYVLIEQSLADPEILADHHKVRELSTQRAALAPVAERYSKLCALHAEVDELRAAAEGDDPELQELAREEIPSVEAQAAALLDKILASLVTAEDNAIGSAILEIRAGVGGDEAGIWAGDILDMLRRYGQRRGWSFEVIDASPSEAGGYKSVVAEVSGEGAYAELSHEAGVHCVKRVPATETQGRVHTSTATVAVLAEPKDVDIEINPDDVDEHITTAQGPGGQNVNKVATAVKLRHRPTGVEVRMQESKSQRQNRDKAWRLLRARLYDIEMQRQQAERSAERAGQIGAGDRSERIRTYRAKDGIAVDHRLNESFPLQKVLAGELDDLAEALRRREVQRRLAAL